MNKIIAFDMDGTIADLYSVDNWLEKLKAENVSPYLEAKPFYDIKAINSALEDLRRLGYVVEIVTWLSKDCSPTYGKEDREAKRLWLERLGFVYDHFHAVKYGTKKQYCLNSNIRDIHQAFIFDDDVRVRCSWLRTFGGGAYDPKKFDIVEMLKIIKENTIS